MGIKSEQRAAAAEFLDKYVNNDCYTEKARESHRLGVEALKNANWEDIKEQTFRFNDEPRLMVSATCSYNRRAESPLL